MGSCFELLRLAMIENRREARGAIYAQSREHVLGWADGNSSDAEDLAHDAFREFRGSVNPKTFASFTGIASVMAYLKRQIAETDAGIDVLMYELYGLTEEEIAIVEGLDRE